MGPEIFITPLAIFGALLCIFLCYRAYRRDSRPFALPTLVASLLWSYYSAVEFKKPDYFWTYYFLSFVGAALIFGLHAHGIKWLLGRSLNKASNEDR